MELPAVETRRPIRETPAQRLVRETGNLLKSLLRLALLAAILTPLILLSFLTLDLPIRVVDHMVDATALKPGLWLSVGGLVMIVVTPAAILMARRFGGDEASRVVTASWGIAAVVTFAEVSYLAPTLDAADLPSVRFVVAFVASAMLAQYVAIGVYDVIRGGGQWWRAPLLAALIGLGLQALVYFPAAYVSTGAPWFVWMVSDLLVKAIAAFAFLGVYLVLQKPLRPSGGYGG